MVMGVLPCGSAVMGDHQGLPGVLLPIAVGSELSQTHPFPTTTNTTKSQAASPVDIRV